MIAEEAAISHSHMCARRGLGPLVEHVWLCALAKKGEGARQLVAVAHCRGSPLVWIRCTVVNSGSRLLEPLRLGFSQRDYCKIV